MLLADGLGLGQDAAEGVSLGEQLLASFLLLLLLGQQLARGRLVEGHRDGLGRLLRLRPLDARLLALRGRRSLLAAPLEALDTLLLLQERLDVEHEAAEGAPHLGVGGGLEELGNILLVLDLLEEVIGRRVLWQQRDEGGVLVVEVDLELVVAAGAREVLDHEAAIHSSITVAFGGRHLHGDIDRISGDSGDIGSDNGDSGHDSAARRGELERDCGPHDAVER